MATNDQREAEGADQPGADPSPAAKEDAAGGQGEKPGSPLEEALAGWRASATSFAHRRRFRQLSQAPRRELDDAHKRGKEELLRELLPIFDNLSAPWFMPQASDAKAVADGVGMVLKQFQDTLGKGDQAHRGRGRPFDPSLHEAIQQVETNDHPAGTIVAEVQPGYARRPPGPRGDGRRQTSARRRRETRAELTLRTVVAPWLRLRGERAGCAGMAKNCQSSARLPPDHRVGCFSSGCFWRRAALL
jgi:molecular chaperone GrpE